MTSSNQNTYEVETNREDDEAVESYVYGDQHLVYWTESFGYTITDLHGRIAIQGKLAGEKVGDNLPFTFLNCYWFTPMGNDIHQMLYLSFTDENNAVLKVANLKTGEITEWAQGLSVKRSYFHNFCWLRYNAETETAQLGYSTEDKVMYYNAIKKGANTTEAHSAACANPNIFFEGGNVMTVACNFKEDQVIEMWHLTPQGINKVVAKFTSKVTVQDFGMLGENLWYFIGIEGEAGKSKKFDDGRGHTSVIYLYDMAGQTWAAHKESLEEDELKIHFLDNAEETKEGGNQMVDMPDGFSMLSNRGGKLVLSSTCANGKFVSWYVTKGDDGQWVVTPVTANHDQKPSKSTKEYEVSSFNRKRLYVWSWSGSSDKKVVVDFYANIDAKVQYLYFLQQLVGGTSKWQDSDLWKAVALLKRD